MLVSVIMPAYNASAYIEQAIGSLLRECGDVMPQIIVIDDGSTDHTVDIVSALMKQQSGLRLICAEHRGVSAARNRGLDELPRQAEFVTFHDADDIAFPGRIARQLAHFEANPHLHVVYGLLQLFDALDPQTMMPHPRARTATVRGVSLSAGLYRRQIIDQLGRFDESLQQAEDTDYLLRLAESGAVIYMEDDIATFYRRHDANTTNDFRVARREFMRVIHKSIQRRRQSPQSSTAPLHALFAERGRIEEQFAACTPCTLS